MRAVRAIARRWHAASSCNRCSGRHARAAHRMRLTRAFQAADRLTLHLFLSPRPYSASAILETIMRTHCRSRFAKTALVVSIAACLVQAVHAAGRDYHPLAREMLQELIEIKSSDSGVGSTPA